VLGPGRQLLDSANPDALAEQIVRRVARETPPSAERPMADGGGIEPLENLTVAPALLSFFCQQLNEARFRSRESEPGASLITAKLVEAEGERIFEEFFQGSGKPRNTLPAAQSQTTGLEEHQGPEEEKLPEPALELLQQEPLPAQADGHVVEALLPSNDKVPDAVLLTQPQTTELEEYQGPEVGKLPEPAPELRQQAPLLTQSGGHVPEEFLPSSDKVPDIALPTATQPQTTDQKERKGPDAGKLAEPAREFPPKKLLLAQAVRRVVKRLKFLAYGLGLLSAIILAILVVLYLKEVQKQQTEIELEEYISNVAAARNTFKSANKKLTLAESELVLKESNILALAAKTRQQEREAQNAREQNSRLAGEQTNFQSRITQLNREKAQAESRLVQWGGLLYDLTNQIAALNQQKYEWNKHEEALNKQEDESKKQMEELKARNDALAVTNLGSVLNFFANWLPGNRLTISNVSAENPLTNSNASAQSQEATTMESFPGKLPATTPTDTKTSLRRQVVVLLTDGQCLYAEDGAKFHALQVHDVLFEGAVIQTGKGSWSDLFIRRTGTTVRLAPESQMRIARLSEASENGVPVLDTLLELRKGRIFTVVRALAPGSTLEISDAAGHSVIEGGGLGCYMITAPGPDAADKLELTPLRVIGRKGTSVVAPGQSYSAKDGATLSLVPSYWEKMLIQLDELEAETDKAIAEPGPPESPIKN